MSSLKSCRPFFYQTKMGVFRTVSFLTAQQVNLPVCSPPCSCDAECQAGKPKIPFFKVVGLTRLGMKRECTDPMADAFTFRSSHRAVSIRIFSRDRGWPDAPHSLSSRSHPLSPSCPICSLLHLQPNSHHILLSLSLPCPLSIHVSV